MSHVDGRVNDSNENGVSGGNDSVVPAPLGQAVGNGVFGFSNVPNASGVFGANNNGGTGVTGIGRGNGAGVVGTSEKNGVVGQTRSDTDAGVNGRNDGGGFGVFGSSEKGSGVEGHSKNGTGVVGFSEQDWAGRFLGDVHVTGSLFKADGGFKIDHPLDPANNICCTPSSNHRT